MKKYIYSILLCLLIFTTLIADEGMWPITEIERIGLDSKGLIIDVKDIYNPEGISLMNAIVRLSGCTGSFVSDKGLIITNHHCAFGYVQRASTVDNDYLTNGFLAENQSKEIPAPGQTASIMEFYMDVSSEVLKSVNNDMDLAERTKAIEKKKKELLLEAEKAYPGKRAEISEMFIGKTYLLFIYTRLRDIRMVYVPPVSVGEFGGENDNWIWPRHTGDFSFFRAYVGPDGSPADYSEENVPYQPKIHFQIAPEGVDEEDFVFIMGYPGRTYRHRTSYYMAYEENIRMPFLADLYENAINVMEGFSQKDPDAALKLSSPIKGYSNRKKNYRGKLAGMSRLDLVNKRREEEARLQVYIDADEERRTKYGSILSEIKNLYNEKSTGAKRGLILSNLSSNRLYTSSQLRNAQTVFKVAENKIKPDVERESAYMDRNIQKTKKRLFLGLKSYYPPAQKVILSHILKLSQELPETYRIKAIDILLSETSIEEFVDQLYKNSQFADEAFLKEALTLDIEDLKEIDDPALNFVRALNPELEESKELDRKYKGILSKFHAKLIDVKKSFYSKDFIPDANSTFRLTYGYIRGYTPKDAIYYSPITTFDGVIEKTTGNKPFVMPDRLIELYKNKKYGQFFNKKLNGVPVAILYNTDTTGGNSGSPVLNAKGYLIGVNFDRAWEATINDYAWSEEYSRSIAVDIRYVLWVTQKFAGADYLLEEMNVSD